MVWSTLGPVLGFRESPLPRSQSFWSTPVPRLLQLHMFLSKSQCPGGGHWAFDSWTSSKAMSPSWVGPAFTPSTMSWNTNTIGVNMHSSLHYNVFNIHCKTVLYADSKILKAIPVHMDQYAAVHSSIRSKIWYKIWKSCSELIVRTGFEWMSVSSLSFSKDYQTVLGRSWWLTLYGWTWGRSAAWANLHSRPWSPVWEKIRARLPSSSSWKTFSVPTPLPYMWYHSCTQAPLPLAHGGKHNSMFFVHVYPENCYNVLIFVFYCSAAVCEK